MFNKGDKASVLALVLPHELIVAMIIAV